MLGLDEVRTFYPETLHRFPRFLLREYLQYKLLEIIYTSPYANQLCFLGGTCLRIVHGNQRFSEDLDFDNIRLNGKELNEITKAIQKGLTREGYEVEIKQVMRRAWHCYIRFPGLLYQEGLSGYQEEKILIQLDTEPQEYDYEPEEFILSKFEVFTTIKTTPPPLLFAQKLFAILKRPRKQGRDFFDVVYVMGKNIKPDFNYLKIKANISNPTQLKASILDICDDLDMKKLAADVEPFLFEPKARDKVVKFPEYFQQSF